MIYLLVGQDHSAKEQKISEIKAKVLPSRDSLSFDCQVLYGHRLDNDSLAQALGALPAVASGRLVVVHQAEELTADQKNLLVELHDKAQKKLTIVLEAEELDAKDMLLKKFGRKVNVGWFSPKLRHNVFDLMRAVSQGQKAEALKLLDELLKDGDYPLQVIGGMFWKWKNDKRQVSSERFRKGLLAFKQADLDIKRSRLKPEHALEVLVVKLCS